MSKIDEKLKLLEDDCLEVAQNDAIILQNEINEISDKEVNNKIQELEEKLSKKYIKEENLLAQEYNKRIFDYENESKRKILKLKSELLKEAENIIKDKFNEFVKKNEYKVYLVNNIQSTLKKIISLQNNIIYLTERDYNIFSVQFEKEYNLTIEKMDNSYIGGCIIKDLINNSIIDNTLKSNIEEKIEKICKTF